MVTPAKTYAYCSLRNFHHTFRCFRRGKQKFSTCFRQHESSSDPMHRFFTPHQAINRKPIGSSLFPDTQDDPVSRIHVLLELGGTNFLHLLARKIRLTLLGMCSGRTCTCCALHPDVWDKNCWIKTPDSQWHVMACVLQGPITWAPSSFLLWKTTPMSMTTLCKKVSSPRSFFSSLNQPSLSFGPLDTWSTILKSYWEKGRILTPRFRQLFPWAQTAIIAKDWLFSSCGLRFTQTEVKSAAMHLQYSGLPAGVIF